MAKHTTDKELDALGGCQSPKEYVARHTDMFPEFYTTSVLSGVKRAASIWYKRERLLAKREIRIAGEVQKKHLIEIKQLKKTEPIASAKRQEPVPDDGEILIKILQELRIHTRQYDDLLAIARAPKGTMSISSMPYVNTNPFAPTKTFTAGDAIADKH